MKPQRPGTVLGMRLRLRKVAVSTVTGFRVRWACIYITYTYTSCLASDEVMLGSIAILLIGFVFISPGRRSRSKPDSRQGQDGPPTVSGMLSKQDARERFLQPVEIVFTADNGQKWAFVHWTEF